MTIMNLLAFIGVTVAHTPYHTIPHHHHHLLLPFIITICSLLYNLRCIALEELADSRVIHPNLREVFDRLEGSILAVAGSDDTQCSHLPNPV